MPAPAPTPTPAPNEALKGFIAEQIGTTISRIDEMDGKVDEALELARTKSNMPAEVHEQLTDLANRLDGFEAAGQGLPRQGGGNDFLKRLEESPFLKRMRNKKGDVEPGALPPSGGGLGAKLGSYLLDPDMIKRAVIDTAALAAPTAYRQGIVDYALDSTSILSLIPRVESGSQVYAYFLEDRISGEGGIVSTADGAITGGAGATLKFAEVEGLQAGATGVIRRTDGAGALLGYETFEVLSFVVGTRVVTMTANIAGNVADGDLVQFTPYAATAESAQKPYTYLKTTELQATLQTIAVLAKVTRQSLKYNRNVDGWIRTKMPKTHNRSIGRKCLYDVKGTGMLDGYLTNSSRQTHNWSDGVVGDTMADCVHRSGLKIPDEGMGPLQVSIRKDDWFSLISEKTADGDYVHGTTAPILVIDRPGLRTIGSMIVGIEAMLKNNGDFLVRNPDCSELVVGTDTAEFAWGYVMGEFGTNQMTARYEEDLAHAILSFQLYTHGNFNERPSASP